MMKTSNKIMTMTCSLGFLLSIALWDIRPFGERYFDLVAIGIASVVLLTNLDPLRKLSNLELGASVYVIVYCFYGYLNFQHRSSLIIAVMFILFITLRHKVASSSFKFSLRVLYIATLFVFFYQFFSHYLTGDFFDFQRLVDQTSRVKYVHVSYGGKSDFYFRPVGFNAEPHSYCVSVALLTLVTLRDKAMRIWHYIGSFSLLMSLSLWGLMLWPCLTLLIVTSQETSARLIFIKFVTCSTLIFGALITAQTVVGKTSVLEHAFINRLAKINNDCDTNKYACDNSIIERFATHVPKPESIKTENRPVRKNLAWSNPVNEPGLVEILFGYGLSTALFIEGKALNGISFLYHAIGLIGSFLFLFLMGWHFKVFVGGNLIHKFATLSVYFSMMLTYPLVTYAFFWFCLAHILEKNICPLNTYKK